LVLLGVVVPAKRLSPNTCIDRIGADAIAWLPYDAYYCDLGHLTLAERQACNFDHPDAFDTELFITHLDQLLAGHAITLPNY
jgi:uridine kinase